MSLQSFSARSLEGWNEHREMSVCLVFPYTNSVSFTFHGVESTVLCFLVVLACAVCCFPWRKKGDEGKQTDPAS